MDKHEMDLETLGYTYACLLAEINNLYKEKKEFEKEFIRRKNDSIQNQNKNKMEVENG